MKYPLLRWGGLGVACVAVVGTSIQGNMLIEEPMAMLAAFTGVGFYVIGLKEAAKADNSGKGDR